MKKGYRQLLLLTSSILFPLALPSPLFPYGSVLLGFISLMPLYLFILHTDSVRELLRGGALFGAISTLIANFWLAFFQDFSVWTLGGTTLGYTAYNIVLFGFLTLFRGYRASYRPLLFALIWLGYEYLKSIGFLAYPWGLAAYTLSAHPILLQIAEVTGVWGLSFAVLLVNGAIAEGASILLGGSNNRPIETRGAAATRAEGLRLLALALMVPTVLLGYGIQSYLSDRPVKKEIGLLMVQQNADSWAPGGFETVLEKAQNLSQTGVASATDAVDLVVWSETSLRRPYPTWRDYYRDNPTTLPFDRFLEELDRPLLTGSPIRGETGYMNGALLLAPDGEVLGSYGKRQLVPFAERVPFWNWEPMRNLFQEYVGLQAVWTPGSSAEPIPLELPSGVTVQLGTPICFEDAFSDVVGETVRRGAEGLVNLTNNSWSRSESAQIQHLAAARFRSIEYRIGLARSTNSGVTTLIDAYGREVTSLPMFQSGSLYVRLPIYEGVGRTPYTYLGPWLPIIALLTTAALLLIRRDERVA